LDKKLTKRSKDSLGHLIVKDCVLSSEQEDDYFPSELGLEGDRPIKVKRSGLNEPETIDSFNGAPITLGHIAVHADSPPKDGICGSVSGVHFKGGKLYGTLRVWDGSAIRAIETGETKELSAGYTYKLSPDHVMNNIMANHVAIVKHGRIGQAAIINDERKTMEKELVNKMINAFKDKGVGQKEIVCALEDLGVPTDEAQDAVARAFGTNIAQDGLEEMFKEHAKHVDECFDKLVKLIEGIQSADAPVVVAEDEQPDLLKVFGVK